MFASVEADLDSFERLPILRVARAALVGNGGGRNASGFTVTAYI